MKAWMAVVALSVMPLVGCGPSRELKRARFEATTARKDADSLREENGALKSKVSELEEEVSSLTKERDELKAAAELQPTPAPAAMPASGKKRPTKK